jgi:pimeloyl-ACP methyl ester carboxylesterase
MSRSIRYRIATGGLLVVLLGGVMVPPAAAGPLPAAGPGTGAATPEVVRQRPCPDSIFTCITIRVPRDHFGPASGPTVNVTFALHKAKAKARKGVFVTVTGGPGTSGIASADSYTAVFDAGIVRDYDIVFFDQRGIGQSVPIQCPNAALAWYTSPDVPTLGPAEALAFAHDSQTFAGDCLAETGVDPAMLPFFSTRQAVEDLEAFRVWLKADTLDLYGESYGTQYAQTYAAAHPDRLHSLMLDGPVDLTLTGTDYYDEDVDAFGSVLLMTLQRCTMDSACRKDVAGHNAVSGYDDLAATLRRGPLPYTFVAADGTITTRSFSLGDLETAAAGYVYSESARMALQRAIAWASHGKLLPLARLAYISLAQDPETLAAIPDETYSDAMYYGVECMDYDYGTGTGEQRAQTYLAAGVTAGVASVRLGSVFYGDLPCAYWPVHPATPARPSYITTTSFPVFVLASTTDPATPFAGALRILSHLANGYFLVQPGGPHVIFGRGNACPDDTITAFLNDGVLPASRTVTCDFTGTDPYVPIPAAKVKDYRNALAAMTATDDELNASADYANWDGVEPLRYGCLFGGTIAYTSYKDGYRVTLGDCAFTAGLALSGAGTIDTTHDTFRLKVSAAGGTNLEYRRDSNGKRTVTGTYFGKAVSLKG